MLKWVIIDVLKFFRGGFMAEETDTKEGGSSFGGKNPEDPLIIKEDGIIKVDCRCYGNQEKKEKDDKK